MAMKVVRQARLELSGGSTPDLLRPIESPPAQFCLCHWLRTERGTQSCSPPPPPHQTLIGGSFCLANKGICNGFSARLSILSYGHMACPTMQARLL